MNGIAAIGAAGIGAGCACVASFVHPPARRLAPRVRPYAIVARTALGHAAAVGAGVTVVAPSLPTGTFRRLFGPPVRAALRAISRVVESRGDDSLERMLRQSGEAGTTPGQYRAKQVVTACISACAAGFATGIAFRTSFIAVMAGAASFVWGAARVRKRLERAITARATRIRLELYTVNHLLAMHVRTGAGAMQAVQRIVDRGQGAVIDELADVLTWARSGMAEGDAFRRAAALTPEPSAARTYQLLATGVERGADLGVALLALSADLRDARREQLHKDAVRRRAAMLIPTIAVLAPIMLLFIAAPLPSIVLGHH